MEGLNAATGFIRYQIGERLRLRRSPEVVFRLDRSGGYQARVEELLKRVEKRKKQREGKGKK
jgi:ribosome-binding factor A